MKVAIFVYPAAFQNPGGGEIQLLKTKEALERKGVEVKLFDQWNDKLSDFDILHVFGSVKDCVGLMQTAKNLHVKIALSTIFWSSFKRAEGESGSAKRRAELLLRHFTKVMVPTFSSARRKTMLLADALLPNSYAEAHQLKRLFAMPQEKIFVVPNGVDARFAQAKPDAFKKNYGFSDFVLAVGRIEPRKNQLALIKAFRNINKELVIVGEPVSDYAEYYALCKKAAGKDVRFIGGLGHESGLLASAYAACEVFVAPGWFETPGLAALEAGLAGAKLAVTKYGCTKEYFLNYVEYFDPSRQEEIIKAINSAVGRRSSVTLKEHIRSHYTWDKVAQKTKEAYEKILHE